MNADDLIAHIDGLPPMPAVVPRLLNLLRDVDADPSQIADLVKIDPSLAAQVLRLANSAFYGFAEQVYDLDAAIQRIGFSETFRLVAMVCGKEVLDRSLQPLGFDPGQLWEHSLSAGFVMEKLAQETRRETASAYTTGLLHAIGKIILGSHKSLNYGRVFDLVKAEGISLDQAERAVLGTDSAELGAALLRRWNFGEEICVPVCYQNRPLETADYKDAACMLHLSVWVVASLGYNYGKFAWAFEAQEGAREAIKIPEERLEAFLLTAHERITHVKSLLKLATVPQQAKS